MEVPLRTVSIIESVERQCSDSFLYGTGTVWLEGAGTRWVAASACAHKFVRCQKSCLWARIQINAVDNFSAYA